MFRNYVFISLLLYFIPVSILSAKIIETNDFKTNDHPRILVTYNDKQNLINKINQVSWARQIYDDLKMEIDPIVEIHSKNPGYVVSRMQMHWEEGKRYTHFYTEGNYVVRREGNAKYPTVRVAYARPAYGSVPLAPIDKIIPYGDGSLPKLVSENIDINRKISTGTGDATLTNLGCDGEWVQIPFEKTGLGTETFNRNFIYLAWKSSILYYLTSEKKYAKLAADIIWVFVRGASQQEQINPNDIGGDFIPNLVHPYMKFDTIYNGKPISRNGYLSFETMGDSRHFATLPLAYDLIYNYLHEEYFDLQQFKEGIKGEEMWAPPHNEGKEWALRRFEVMFKRLIENKIMRGGGIEGNWNINEQQSAIFYALALDNNCEYKDGKGREYYVNLLINGPSTKSHGAYMDLWHGNISPNTGLWPEAPGSYGQNSLGQLVMFGFIYYKNGLDLFPRIPQFRKSLISSLQLLFPNNRTTGYGDSEYKLLINYPAELVLRYAKEKKDNDLTKLALQVMKVSEKRNYVDEFYLPLFYFLDSIPVSKSFVELERAFYSKTHSLVMERNLGTNFKNSLAFTLYGFGAKAGHRHPNGMAMELYGCGYVQGADQLRGHDYWGRDAHDYKANVAGHNTVSPNGKGALDDMPQDINIIFSEPFVWDGKSNTAISPNNNYIEALNYFNTDEIEAEQRRMMSIIRTSPENGYYVDIFRSKVTNGDNNYHDYIYHNMGVTSKIINLEEGKKIGFIPLDTLSGLGYSFFNTKRSIESSKNLQVDFDFGLDNVHMKMFITGNEGRVIYQMDAEKNFRYYVSDLTDMRVPTILVRQKGEAWNNPFVVVYEPYGNGIDADIIKVVTDSTKCNGITKLTVERRKNKKEHIIYSLNDNTTVNYQGILFNGRYLVVSISEDKVKSIYVVGGKTLKIKDLSLTSFSDKLFNAWVVCNGKEFEVSSNNNIKISSNYNIKFKKI